MREKNFVNISEINKSFIWTPPKTASSLAQLIFGKEYFGFQYYDSEKNNIRNNFQHKHYYCFFDGHENYKFILTIRNPYTQYLSYIGYEINDKTILLLESIFHSENHNNLINGLKRRRPDYVIKVENLFEDYSNIPFIADSELFNSGELLKIIDTKPNQLLDKPKFTITEELVDLIYYNNSVIFDMFGYKKDSWKSL